MIRSGMPKLHIEEPLATTVGPGRMVCMSKLPLRDSAGEVVGVLGAYEDVTERVQAERALLESERRFQAFMDRTPVYAYIKDEALRHVYQNQRVMDLACCGVSVDDLSAGSFLGAETAAKVEEADRRILAGETDRMELEYSVTIHGQTRWLADVKFALSLADGRKAVGGMAFDITERKVAEAEKERLWSQLTEAQRMESIGRLAGGVAHDFNNMLQAILGYGELASALLPPDHPQQQELGEITRVAERAASVTRQLLAFARRQTVQPRVLDLGEEVSGTMGMLRHLIGENIALAWSQSQDLWPVRVDPSQIGMVLTNLCVNARDAIASTGRIVIECRNTVVEEGCHEGQGDVRPGEYVTLSVSDDGCGMDAETQALVFEPFFTTKEVGKGTGLGLATVHGVAMQNGGFVSIESKVGEGTTMRVHFPRCEGTSQTNANACEAVSTSPLPTGNETILVAEDEISILEVCEAVLGKLGYRILPAALPGEAIEWARTYGGRIDLLVTDVVMPETNGRALAESVARHQPGIACLYISGYPADAIAHHGILEDGLDFLQKPFSNRDLAEAVRRILDRRRK